MVKYHINPNTGEPSQCRAKTSCPFGDIKNDHFDSKEAARTTYEKEMTAELVPEGASKKTLTRSDMDRIVSEARARGERPNLSDASLLDADLSGTDLRGADLSGANLYGADLSGANLYGTNLRGTNLREANLYMASLSGADLSDADLSEADLRGANLREADLYEADLREADLRAADLRGADLRWANLSDANLRGANLSDANLYGADLSESNLSGTDLLLRFDGFPSGQATLTPTPQGWMLTVGGWSGTVQGFRDHIAGTEWPEAKGDEQDRRRPGLALLADLCDVHIARHPSVIDTLAKRWA